MSEDKPLHVRVAEALGIVICDQWTVLDMDPWNGPTYRANCTHKGCVPSQRPPRYDTDWSATGPLVEKYGLTLAKCEDQEVWLAAPRQEYLDESAGYLAYASRPFMQGETPLIAVCNLILALKEAGKL